MNSASWYYITIICMHYLKAQVLEICLIYYMYKPVARPYKQYQQILNTHACYTMYVIIKYYTHTQSQLHIILVKMYKNIKAE